MLNLGQILHTVRYLRAEQVIFQVWSRLKRRLMSPRMFFARFRPPPFASIRSYAHPFLEPEIGVNHSQSLLQGDFSFLNHSERLGWPPDWTDADRAKLWVYNLHYFDWLWALPAKEAQIVVTDWIDKVTPSYEQSAWEAYPTSLRVTNWLGYFFLTARHSDACSVALKQKIWRSMASQAEWLSRHLERHLLGNHLFENGTALCLMGSAFEGKEADRWFQLGWGVIERELSEQVLQDGMHFELSPMYHVRIVYLLVLLQTFGREEVQPPVREALLRAKKAMILMRHPDGEIALFNDSVMGVYQRPASLTGSADMFGCFALESAGYFGYRSKDQDYVVVKAGQIGPDYQPGHAHGDLFAFEMSVRGQRVFTDSGIASYVAGPTRKWTRSTAAHNTLEVEGEDQADFWGCFRVGRRPHIVSRRWEPRECGFLLEAAHDGYERLPCRARCTRTLILNAASRELTLQDEVMARNFPTNYSVSLHLHPECKVVELGDCEAVVSGKCGVVRISYEGKGELMIMETRYYERFGVGKKRQTLTFRGEMREHQTVVKTLICY